MGPAVQLLALKNAITEVCNPQGNAEKAAKRSINTFKNAIKNAVKDARKRAAKAGAKSKETTDADKPFAVEQMLAICDGFAGDL